jgi:hypothetical protein
MAQPKHTPLKLTMTKCQCGDKNCNSYRLHPSKAEGMFEQEDAAYIVKAVNCHAELIEALQEVSRLSANASDPLKKLKLKTIYEVASTALAKAKGETP